MKSTIANILEDHALSFPARSAPPVRPLIWPTVDELTAMIVTEYCAVASYRARQSRQRRRRPSNCAAAMDAHFMIESSIAAIAAIRL
ncbi:hypothetical protein HFO93_30985 [Rhizobium leguminosarum]|uniref:hypothetical protein n=1 Tax=Rhizobium leguminosarum TaxID=384 RepID=UPI001C95E144|nr:hypothetical protein [Rhizobium leguminosarum]MBY5447788.1 hypothetical protein [Rhizobium leguminosarum]